MDQAQRVSRLTVDSKYLRKILQGKLDHTKTKILTAKKKQLLSSRNSSLYITLNKRKITWYKLHNQVQVTEQGTSYNQATSYITRYLTHKTY